LREFRKHLGKLPASEDVRLQRLIPWRDGRLKSTALSRVAEDGESVTRTHATRSIDNEQHVYWTDNNVISNYHLWLFTEIPGR